MSQEMFVNAQALATMPALSPVLVQACHRAHEQGGLTAGQFLQSLSETDIDALLHYARQAQTDSEALMAFSLFTIVLANGEGYCVTVQDNLSLLVRRVILMVQAEMLHREGLLQLRHDAVSMEAFDISKLPLTEKGRQKFGGVKVIATPVPGKSESSSKPDASSH